MTDARRVLVVAAHPDDETFGMGGTIAKHADRGDEVHLCVLADGVSVWQGSLEERKRCARAAGGVLGIRDFTFFDMPDERLESMPLLRVARAVEECFLKTKPEIVYTPDRTDVNQDHRIAFEATLVACRPKPGGIVRRVLSYEVPGSTEWGAVASGLPFLPSVYVDIEATIERKLAAAREYAATHPSELKPFPHPRSLEGLRAYAVHRGLNAGLACAEAFHLVRSIE